MFFLIYQFFSEFKLVSKIVHSHVLGLNKQKEKDKRKNTQISFFTQVSHRESSYAAKEKTTKNTGNCV